MQCRQYTPMVGLSLMPLRLQLLLSVISSARCPLVRSTGIPPHLRTERPIVLKLATATHIHSIYCSNRLTWRFHMIGGDFTWWLTYWCIFSYFHRQPKIGVNQTRLWMFWLADRCRTWINANNHFIYVRTRAYLRYIAVVDFHKKILQFLWSYPPRIFVHLKYTTTPTLGWK